MQYKLLHEYPSPITLEINLMKNLLILLSIVLISSCSRSPVHSFIDEYNQEDHTVSLTVPGWLVRKGSTAAFKDIGDEEDQAGLKEIANKLGKVRVMVAREGVVPTKAVKELITEARGHQYEEYVTVRDDGKIVNVMAKQNAEIVENLLVLVSSDDEFVIAHIDANISMEDLQKAQISWNKDRNKKN